VLSLDGRYLFSNYSFAALYKGVFIDMVTTVLETALLLCFILIFVLISRIYRVYWRLNPTSFLP
jgi:hypothetical protein